MRPLRHAAPLLALAIVSGACASGILPSKPAVDPTVTCAVWVTLGDDERLDLADRLMDSPERMEGVRKTQRQPVGTAREVLVRDVVGSLSKGCDVWAPPGRPVSEVFLAIYASG